MAKLTEQEQQEIIRYIEADKPLPDKYRFLLFGDKREVELVWNGKTSEVCNKVFNRTAPVNPDVRQELRVTTHTRDN